jgi:hypothetical protein
MAHSDLIGAMTRPIAGSRCRSFLGSRMRERLSRTGNSVRCAAVRNQPLQRPALRAGGDECASERLLPTRRNGLELAGRVLTRARGRDIIEQTTKDHSSLLIRDKVSGP